MATTYCQLATSRPANTDEAALYLVPASTQIVGILRISNQDSAQRTYRVAHCSNTGTAENSEFLIYDKPIDAYDTHEISINANAAEEIRIKASVADKLAFNLSGMKIT
jgi:hypothetical protein